MQDVELSFRVKVETRHPEETKRYMEAILAHLGFAVEDSVLKARPIVVIEG